MAAQGSGTMVGVGGQVALKQEARGTWWGQAQDYTLLHGAADGIWGLVLPLNCFLASGFKSILLCRTKQARGAPPF